MLLTQNGTPSSSPGQHHHEAETPGAQPMTVLQRHTVQRLREFRAGLLDIKSDDLNS
jgi:hypothetical protein